jgi:hypothetical protein
MSESFWDKEFDEPSVGPNEWVDEPNPQQTQVTDEPVSNDTLSLLNLGELRTHMDVRGHSVELRTLKMDEELEIGLVIQRYQGTIEEGRALATAVVATAVENIDGKPLISTLGPGENIISRKFDYVRTRMYWPVIKIIYEEGYIPLVERQVESLEELLKK